MSEIYLRLNLIYGSSHRTPVGCFGMVDEPSTAFHPRSCFLLEYTASYAPLSISLYALSTPSLSSSRPADHSALAARTCGMRSPAVVTIAFEIVADTDIWTEAARESTVITRGSARSGEKARAEINGAQRGENTVITQQLRESKAISARTEIDGARIFVPSDVFGQHTLGSLN
ncbi:hypothetical protein C8J57DRAFT_1510603 [Mycena rebaudengoi]|nr:hypothetical protein C8J57DRAFT_1510603 [Mycena rebaudengoi]